jgi:hypothetical protein
VIAGWLDGPIVDAGAPLAVGVPLAAGERVLSPCDAAGTAGDAVGVDDDWHALSVIAATTTAATNLARRAVATERV